MQALDAIKRTCQVGYLTESDGEFRGSVLSARIDERRWALFIAEKKYFLYLCKIYSKKKRKEDFLLK